VISCLIISNFIHSGHLLYLVFVEALDKCFENVCELDLIFHSDKVCIVCDFDSRVFS
jgi:hypothetical protein